MEGLRECSLPARDGEERAEARIPSKRAIHLECRKMETARSERENDQCVDER